MAYNGLACYLTALLESEMMEQDAGYSALVRSRNFGNFQDLSELQQRRREFTEKRSKISGHEVQVHVAKFLGDSILLSRRLKCSQARDTLYALLGMVGAKDLPDILKPDYSKPLKQIYRDYATFIVDLSGSLAVLHTIHTELTDSPTWVPNLRWSPGNYYEDEHSGPVCFVDDELTMVLQGCQVGLVTATYDGSPDLLLQKVAILHGDNSLSLATSFDSFLDRVADVKG